MNIFEAAIQGSIQDIENFINSGVDINCKDSEGYTPLLLSIENNHNEIAKVLIDKGADIESTNTDRWTPLMLASHQNNPDLAKYIIDKGANINAKNVEGWTALMSAVARNNCETAGLLLKHGADCNTKTDEGLTALIYATQENLEEAFDCLLRAEVNINDTDNYRGTALMVAARKGHINLVRKLIAEGANIESISDYVSKDGIAGMTAIKFAIEEGHREIASLLNNAQKLKLLSFYSLNMPLELAVRAEINFHEQEKISVYLENNSSRGKELFGELLLFSGFALRILVNFGQQHPGPSIADTLIRCSTDVINIDKLIDCELVDYQGTSGRKKFIAELKLTNCDFKFYLKTKGFGLLARGMGFYGPVSVFMLAKFLIKKRAKNPDYLEKLAQIMSRCGSIYFDGKLSLMTQKEDALTISMSVAGEYLKCI